MIVDQVDVVGMAVLEAEDHLPVAGGTRISGAERAEVQRADISRICKVDLDRFTVDRLVRIANRLDRRVEVVVSAAEPRRAVANKEAV